MYKILLKMKKIYNRESWLKMVEQAKERGKITEEEYQDLINDDETSDNRSQIKTLEEIEQEMDVAEYHCRKYVDEEETL